MAKFGSSNNAGVTWRVSRSDRYVFRRLDGMSEDRIRELADEAGLYLYRPRGYMVNARGRIKISRSNEPTPHELSVIRFAKLVEDEVTSNDH